MSEHPAKCCASAAGLSEGSPIRRRRHCRADGIPLARVEQVLSMVQEPTSLDAPVGEDGDATLAI